MRGIAAKYAHPIENTSGEAIPPFSVVLVTGVTTNADKSLTWSTVKKYDGSAGNIMVTGETAIPSKRKNPETGVIENGRGTAFYDDFLYVAVDSTGPAGAGETWGPVSGKWTIGASGSGFSSQGPLLVGSTPLRALFHRESKGGGAQIIKFAITGTDCDAGTATGIVTAVMCSGSEVAVGDEVDLIDSMSLLTGNPDLVMGGSGFAVKMNEPGSYGSGCAYDIIQTGDLGFSCG